MIRWIVSLAVCALVSVPAVRAEDEKVPLDKLPKAVSDAVKKKYPKAKMVSAEKEKKDKKTVYEVKIKDGEQTIEVSLTPEGEIVEIEKVIAAKDLPTAVTTALGEKYPKAKIVKVEEITKGEKVTYEVLLVTADKKKLEVTFDGTGKVLEVEKKDEKKEEKKEK